MGRKVQISPWESVSQDPTLDKERVNGCAWNQKGQLMVNRLHDFEETVPKNLEPAV